MTQYWIKHDDGTLLGPITLQVLGDLAAAGQLGKIREASTDGRLWAPVTAFPELSARVRAGQPHEASEASQIRAELEAARARPLHEVFGVPADASLDQLRAAFFALVKRYHPQRLPPTASAPLREACREMFRFLSDSMLLAQSRASASAANPPPPRVEASIRAEDFVGLRKKPDGRLEADVLVGVRTAELFTHHKLVNASTGGFFLAEQNFPLGTGLDVTLRFEGSDQRFSTRGKVVFENAGRDPRQPRGTGVQLHLSSTEKAFLQKFIGDVVASKT